MRDEVRPGAYCGVGRLGIGLFLLSDGIGYRTLERNDFCVQERVSV